MNRSTNKSHHRWVDRGIAAGRARSYDYECKHCGAYRIKSDVLTYKYVKDGKQSDRAPECDRMDLQ